MESGDGIDPSWEPWPWTLDGAEERAQRRGFRLRARLPIAWRAVPWSAFPEAGIFGMPRQWFIETEIECTATFAGEDFVLVKRVWSGWPDPPEFALASRPAGREGGEWSRWGSFDRLPPAWSVPDDDPPRAEPDPLPDA